MQIENEPQLSRFACLRFFAASCSRFKCVCFDMRSSTKDKVKGRLREGKGTVKEKAGRATRDPDLQDRGTSEKVGGKVQRKVGEVKKVFGG
jgi:uncharacterized protein YjbJ (UPF0337 family)